MPNEIVSLSRLNAKGSTKLPFDLKPNKLGANLARNTAAIFLIEFLNTPYGVDNFLLSRIKRMA